MLPSKKCWQGFTAEPAGKTDKSLLMLKHNSQAFLGAQPSTGDGGGALPHEIIAAVCQAIDYVLLISLGADHDDRHHSIRYSLP